MFADRREAGRKLAIQLGDYAGREDAIVLGLPRGGIPVAYEIASALRLPLDVFLTRKLGVPGEEELAFGAIAAGGVIVLEPETVRMFGLTADEIESIAGTQRSELQRRERLYRRDRPPLELAGRTVILVDDGIATGADMKAAVKALRLLSPARIVAAVPVAPAENCDAARFGADEMICLATPARFYGVGQFYSSFPPVSDEEVARLLERGAAPATNHEVKQGTNQGVER
ncbi:MAG TPA: phosphoribosyltransferase [Terriglobales bacterium]|nr:phosphoribosyltransferase [Terriglobales bacterium]